MAVPPNPFTPPPSTSDHKGKLDIPKLKDATLVGSGSPESCTLILTQGDLAKNFDMSRYKYGVFPLEGKLLNVRDASPQELQQNAEIQNIMNILGLQVGKTYENLKELRYGHLMIMANKGHGSLHIIGLLINFLHYFWPSLLQKVKGFMSVFMTPFVKATSMNTNEVSLFYTMPDYQKWLRILGNKVTEYKINYLEGLKSKERAKFVDQHVKEFVWFDDLDGREIKIAFSKKIEVIREWLQSDQGDMTQISLQKETLPYLYSKEKHIRYRDFISIDFKRYVEADLQRSIPSMVDGLTPGQRKILFYALKKPIIQKIEVDEFTAYVFKQSPYHPSEERSLVGNIIGMAQKYVGSNNINLLEPNGRFGTRLRGGIDHVASGRCLYTQLSPITRYLFPEADELILHYDGQSPEPAWLCPIIPMVLVNGSEGRGAVCSSFIPNYHPRDIIANITRLLEGEAVVPMIPWYNGFEGDIEETKTPSKDTLYTTKGIIEDDDNGIIITELPVGTWTNFYGESLEAAVGKDIEDYTARHGEINSVRFEITMTDKQKKSAKDEGIFDKFKLTTTFSTANMHLLGSDHQLKKYDTPEQILKDFFEFRLKLYEKRKTARLHELMIAILLLTNKMDFIRKVLKGEMFLLPPRTEEERCAELMEKGFQSSLKIEWMVAPLGTKPPTEEEELRTGYDYLMSTPLSSFSYGEMEELQKEKDTMENELRELTIASPKSLWRKDLKDLIRKLNALIKISLAGKISPSKRASTRCSQTTKGELEESYVASDSDEEEPEDDNDATEDSDFEDEEE
ncbi:DNA topoisomerase 2 [Artemisia annua]|uniref:DNA topoisomerase (ATP-hydrolyzing) n=1 Tax=Artemisia annua TaxID=35608 RepID=A0A2U1KV93_ARTAN|nr:DNA topoisomerase 2 [Artemisia annua]